MEKDCEFCHEKIEVEAKKCKVCGEPFYLMGKVLKLAPLLSIVITLLSLNFAFFEMRGKDKATKKAETEVAKRVEAIKRAEEEKQGRLAVTREMQTKGRAAQRAIREIASAVPEEKKINIIKGLQLRPGITLGQLEKEAKTAPEDSELQRKMYLFRAFKRPG